MLFRSARETLAFFLSETPFVTNLYERFRSGFDEERSLAIDGIKELLLETRDRLVRRRPRLAKRVTVKALRLYLPSVPNTSSVRRPPSPPRTPTSSQLKKGFLDDENTYCKAHVV